mgnify:CR=1 FL=1
MSKSIQQLIEIYENELSSLLNQKNTSTKISNIAEPIKGQEVKLANQNFKIVAVEKFLSLTDAKKIDDFLNDEDKKDRKSTRLNSSHTDISRMPSSA